jgi:hypothetical protein
MTASQQSYPASALYDIDSGARHDSFDLTDPLTRRRVVHAKRKPASRGAEAGLDRVCQ